MNTCKTCRYWEHESDAPPLRIRIREQAGGTCRCAKLTEDKGRYGADMLVYAYNEGGWFWTGPNFGCVHHKKGTA